MSDNTWTKKYLKPLVGKTIIAVNVSEDGFPLLTLNDGTVLEISQDEEGNGGGFIFGLPRVK
jgi:hypothetical protein